MAELLVDAKLAGDRARTAGVQRVDDTARARLRARYARLLADGQTANPPPPASGRRRGRTRRSPAARLLARLDTHRDEVLRCLDDIRVPFDNNQAERDLRMVKLQQKISGCWRTPAGAEGFLAPAQLPVHRPQAPDEPAGCARSAVSGAGLAATAGAAASAAGA
jgi:transposase